jgi:hypothetical protein
VDQQPCEFERTPEGTRSPLASDLDVGKCFLHAFDVRPGMLDDYGDASVLGEELQQRQIVAVVRMHFGAKLG